VVAGRAGPPALRSGTWPGRSSLAGEGAAGEDVVAVELKPAVLSADRQRQPCCLDRKGRSTGRDRSPASTGKGRSPLGTERAGRTAYWGNELVPVASSVSPMSPQPERDVCSEIFAYVFFVLIPCGKTAPINSVHHDNITALWNIYLLTYLVFWMGDGTFVAGLWQSMSSRSGWCWCCVRLFRL
jgi:hypothetical protein